MDLGRNHPEISTKSCLLPWAWPEPPKFRELVGKVSSISPERSLGDVRINIE
jgi:hypothetical protein